MRVNLTDRRIAALQGDAAGKLRPELRDAVVPGLIVRAAAKRKTFMLHARFPGGKEATRRAIAEVGAVTLDGARDTARDWLMKIKRGIDPKAEARDAERAARDQARLQQQNLFSTICEDYLRDKANKRQISLKRLTPVRLPPGRASVSSRSRSAAAEGCPLSGE